MRKIAVSIFNGFLLLIVGCFAPSSPSPGEAEPLVATTFQWQRAADAFAPRWGQFLLSGRPAGGSADQSGPVLGEVFAPDTLAPLDVTISPRWCSCGFVVPSQNELVVVGGYAQGFVELSTAEVVPLDGGPVTQIDLAVTLPHPLGCAAYFDVDSNRGYVFGGGSDSTSVFSSDTLAYDPSTHTFSVVGSASGDNPHPSGRYDAAWAGLSTSAGPSDDIVLLAGRGGEDFALDFPTDVWTFHPSSETWEQIEVDDDAMPGRRFPAFTLSPSKNAVVLAFGADTSGGDRQLEDVWLFDLSTRTLRVVDVQADDDGAAPIPRVFTPFVSSSEPLLAGGIGRVGGRLQVLQDDAFVLHSDADQWH